MKKIKTCILCHKEYTGYGNNPEQLAKYEDGQCCNECNANKVLPERFKKLKVIVSKIPNNINKMGVQ